MLVCSCQCFLRIYSCHNLRNKFSLASRVTCKMLIMTNFPDPLSPELLHTATEGNTVHVSHCCLSAAWQGIKLAVVSNFDTRLKPILKGLGVLDLFHGVVVSAEVGAEKPNPVIFEIACRILGVEPGEALVIGDDRR